MNEGRIGEAQTIAMKYNQLFNDLFIESNPVPVKVALALMHPDIFTDEVRLPLCHLLEASKTKLISTMKNAGLLSAEK
jgi:4-hydroxy-tetrahydrodipicolinate synthase